MINNKMIELFEDWSCGDCLFQYFGEVDKYGENDEETASWFAYDEYSRWSAYLFHVKHNHKACSLD